MWYLSLYLEPAFMPACVYPYTFLFNYNSISYLILSIYYRKIARMKAVRVQTTAIPLTSTVNDRSGNTMWVSYTLYL